MYSPFYTNEAGITTTLCGDVFLREGELHPACLRKSAAGNVERYARVDNISNLSV